MTLSPRMRIVVIGVGNPWRQDDGAGWAAVDAASARLDGDVELVRTDGEPARLIEVWTGADLAVLVDAVRTGSPAGTVHRLDLGEDTLGPTRATSSHGLGINEAVQLGRALGRMPRRLILFGIEGNDFSHGPRPGRAVTDAAYRVAEAIAQVVGGASATR